MCERMCGCTVWAIAAATPTTAISYSFIWTILFESLEWNKCVYVCVSEWMSSVRFMCPNWRFRTWIIKLWVQCAASLSLYVLFLICVVSLVNFTILTFPFPALIGCGNYHFISFSLSITHKCLRYTRCTWMVYSNRHNNIDIRFFKLVFCAGKMHEKSSVCSDFVDCTLESLIEWRQHWSVIAATAAARSQCLFECLRSP